MALDAGDRAVTEPLRRLREGWRRFGAAGLAPLVARKLLERTLGDRSSKAGRRAGAELDRAYGIETSQVAELTELRVRGQHRDLGVRYEPTSPALFARAMKKLEIDPNEYTFVDYGCGKGRVMILAAEHGFLRILGIDFSPDLCELAEANVRAYSRVRDDRTRRFEVVCADASDYTPPAGDCVLFCYNPFVEALVHAVVARIEQSLLADPRDVFFVYVNPQWRRLLDRCELLERHASAVWSPEWFVIYRSRAPHVPPSQSAV
jgi:SAM-dependent methyltransferase